MPHPRVTAVREKPTVYLNFDKKQMPRGFRDLSLDDSVIVVLRGKVTSVSQHQDGSALSVEYTRLELVNNAKPATMDQVLEDLRGDR